MGKHWKGLVVFMKERQIKVFDSLAGRDWVSRDSDMRYLKGVFKYLDDEHRERRGTPLPDPSLWRLVINNPDITPGQRNGDDCGLFMCLIADFISLNHPLILSQKHVTKFRRWLALSLLKKKMAV